jgi:hypothetical protein
MVVASPKATQSLLAGHVSLKNADVASGKQAAPAAVSKITSFSE